MYSQPLRMLTVAEDKGRSDRMTAVQVSIDHKEVHELTFSIDDHGILYIIKYKDAIREANFSFDGFDIEGMLYYLQQVKEYLEESKTVRKLMGVE